MEQITNVLPRKAWEQVVIHENNEPLVELKETPKLRLGGVFKEYEPLFLVRKTIAEKLYRLSETLPDEICLVVIEGYRTMWSQQEEWNRMFTQIKRQDLSLLDEEVEQRVRMLVAKPHPLANHHCGGAIDVTLATEDGSLLDMGTPYISEIKEEAQRVKIPMFSELITKEQENNRGLLRTAMEQEDFVWYPGEWWHYCYGDRMWAVYSKREECFYGPIEP